MKNIATSDRAIGMLKVKSIYNRVRGPAKTYTACLFIYSRSPARRVRRLVSTTVQEEIGLIRNKDTIIQDEKEEAKEE